MESADGWRRGVTHFFTPSAATARSLLRPEQPMASGSLHQPASTYGQILMSHCAIHQQLHILRRQSGADRRPRARGGRGHVRHRGAHVLPNSPGANRKALKSNSSAHIHLAHCTRALSMAASLPTIPHCAPWPASSTAFPNPVRRYEKVVCHTTQSSSVPSQQRPTTLSC